jgi:hypothetical protein
MYFKSALAPFLGVFLPFVLFLALTLLPYVLGKRKEGAEARKSGGFLQKLLNRPEGFLAGGLIGSVFVALVVAALFGSLYAGTFRSPTLGCNSCHNISMGTRMGVPPVAFKDRNIVPLLEDEQWMAEHWFYPQVVW